MKKIIGVYSAPRQHWVGDGFPVRSLFSYHSHGKTLGPFLLLDRAGPASSPPPANPEGTRLPTTYPSPAYTARPASSARANALTFCIPSQIALGPG